MTIFWQKNKSCSVKSQSAMTVQCTLRGRVTHFKRKNAKKNFFHRWRRRHWRDSNPRRVEGPTTVPPPIEPGKSHRREKLSTVDLLVLTGLDELLLILKILFTSFTEQATLMRRSTVLSLSLSVSLPGVKQKGYLRR
jgi:hypothetical protein